MLTSARADLLTIGVALSVYFASNGVESLRIALNRSYEVTDQRNWLLLRLESIGYVLLAAVSLLVFALLVVLAPLFWSRVVRLVPELDPFGAWITFARFAVAGLVLIIALVIAHLWLPAGRRHMREVAPGIVATLVMWLICGAAFGRYLAEFAFNYVTMYASLASAMIALVYLYFTASIFIYGGELNSAIIRERKMRAKAHQVTLVDLPDQRVA